MPIQPPGDGDRVVLRRDPEADRFVALWLAKGRVVAGLHGNDWDAAKPIGRLVREGVFLDVPRFRDTRIPLEEQLEGEKAA